jgi:integrase
MACAFGTPKRRPESGIYWFRKRVPDRLKAKVGKREIKFSLRTRDPDVARLRNLQAMVEIERAWAAYDLAGVRAAPRSVVPIQDNSTQSAVFMAGVSLTAETSQSGPDASTGPDANGAAASLRTIFESYAEEAELAPATVKRWAPVIDRFVVHLGHDDPRRIDRTDVVAWKDILMKEGRTAVTVRDVYLAAIRATLQYGVDQGLLAENPAGRVKVRVKKPLHHREKGFDHEEARTILAATLLPASEKISIEMAAARRWVPWLCAYTGARVNEITCLSGRDIVERNGIAMIRIPAETNKTRKSRDVPLHPHVIEQGFLDYARSRPGPLFYAPARARGGKNGNPHYKKIGERLAEWVRSLNVDSRVAPNHGWRHRFSSVARFVGMPEDIRNVIQGHAAATVADRYGDTWPEAAYREIKKIPAYLVSRGGYSAGQASAGRSRTGLASVKITECLRSGGHFKRRRNPVS